MSKLWSKSSSHVLRKGLYRVLDGVDRFTSYFPSSYMRLLYIIRYDT